ncbi:MAG: DUF4129 domain-containing protein [Chryseotalea sp.]|jgi:hypothetical protein|nr:DUF4129 domain-containing protein [Flammeovirgaceae bacterium]
MKNALFLFFTVIVLLVAGTHTVWAQEESDSIDYTYYNEEEESAYTVLEPEQTEQAKQYKAEPITVKKFDEAKWKEIVEDETFTEKKAKEKSKSKFDPNLSALSPMLQLIFKVIGYVAIFFILLGIVYLIVKNATTSTGSVKKRTDLFDTLSKAIDDINQVDLELWLKQALEQGNLKAAIRVYFLLTLRNLQQAGLVKYQKDKTNRDYLFEMANKPHAEQFRKVTQTYEWVWYGDQEINKQQFDVFETTFVSINNQVTGNTHATA